MAKVDIYPLISSFILACKLDIVFILETSTYSKDEKYLYLKSFFSKLAQQISVSSDTVRIGAITYNRGGYMAFDLQTYTTSDDVSHAILKIPDSTENRFLIDGALSYARSTFFTAANGDREDAANYYVFTIGGIRSGAAKQGALIAENWPDTVFAIGKGVNISSLKYVCVTQNRLKKKTCFDFCITQYRYVIIIYILNTLIDNGFNIYSSNITRYIKYVHVFKTQMSVSKYSSSTEISRSTVTSCSYKISYPVKAVAA